MELCSCPADLLIVPDDDKAGHEHRMESAQDGVKIFIYVTAKIRKRGD